jgi:hypothetical protein
MERAERPLRPSFLPLWASLAQRALMVAPESFSSFRLPMCRLRESEERRGETKAGFATRKECRAAMAKVLVAVEEKTYVVSTKVTVREFLQKERLPSICATIRPTTYRSYVQHVECHIVPLDQILLPISSA